MEVIFKKIKKNKLNDYKEFKEIFLWNITIIKEEGNKIFLKLERDSNLKNIDKLKELEKENTIAHFPSVLIYLPAIVSFILMTTFLILFMLNKDTIKVIPGMLPFFIPSCFGLFASVMLSYLKANQIKKEAFIKNNNYLDIKNKVKEISE